MGVDPRRRGSRRDGVGASDLIEERVLVGAQLVVADGERQQAHGGECHHDPGQQWEARFRHGCPRVLLLPRQCQLTAALVADTVGGFDPQPVFSLCRAGDQLVDQIVELGAD